MNALAIDKLNLNAPPVVKTIAQRSLVIGVIAAVIAAVIAVRDPDQFFQAYLLGFMAWLGVALGSMAILMLRHLTKGAWGMIIRRILGAAMRTVPLLTVLFVPVLLGMKHLYVWTRPADIAKNHHLREITRTYLFT